MSLAMQKYRVDNRLKSLIGDWLYYILVDRIHESTELTLLAKTFDKFRKFCFLLFTQI
jgi:hypothetical protein